jgi:hypothetical protein
MNRTARIVAALQREGFEVRTENQGTKILFAGPKYEEMGEVFISPTGAVNLSLGLPMKIARVIYAAAQE